MFRIKQRVVFNRIYLIFIRNKSFISKNAVKQSISTSDNIREIREKHAILFDKSFKEIVGQLTDNEFNKESIELKNANQWFKTVLEYNVLNGKRNRGLMAVLTYDILAQPHQRSELQMESVWALGWALELFQTYFLVIDDIMDDSITRRGKKCWYRQSSVGLKACNDAALIESGIYALIKHHFRAKSFYVEIIELIHEIFRKTAYGQCMDILAEPEGTQPDLNTYSSEKYFSIVKYKTSFYTFVLPIRLAMYLTNNNSEKDHSLVEEILLKMGHLFQVQDDYLDCFGDPLVIGKIGTDIEDGKCCWNIVTALRVCTKDQRQVLQSNYGKKDIECVLRVKQIYSEIDLINIFNNYEKTLLNEISEMISVFEKETNVTKNIFIEPLNQINKRNK